MKTITILLLLAIGLTAMAQTTPTVDLLWSANTYTPPFYSGHTVATANSQIRVIALVNWPGKKSGDLNFSWQKAGQALSKSSGPGKDVLTFNSGNVGEKNQIALIVSDGSGTRIQQTVNIAVTNPAISFYQNDPLLGVNYGRAIGDTLTLTQPEINLLAEPYFFTLSDVQNKKLTYDWQLDGKKVVPDASDNRFITFAAPSGTKGENTITLALKNLSNVFQDASDQFGIQFGLGQDFNF